MFTPTFSMIHLSMVQYHYEKERKHRERVERYQTNTTKVCLVRIIESFDGKKDVDHDMPDAPKFIQSRILMNAFDGDKTKVKLSHYNYAIVMLLADRNMDMIYREEMPSSIKCKAYLYDIVVAMKLLNMAGLSHGDLKARNCLRMKSQILITDLDASSELQKEGEGVSSQDQIYVSMYVGAKFSSGILPPEMIYKINNYEEMNKYKSYFAELKNMDTNQRRKLWPVSNGGRGGYVVKSFLMVNGKERMDLDGNAHTPVLAKDMNKLPYKLIQSSPAIDLWSFGLMMYKFEAKMDLFLTDDQKDDLRGFEEIRMLSCWDDNAKNDAILKIRNPSARDLLSMLLSRDPAQRGTIDKVIHHPYFTGRPMPPPPQDQKPISSPIVEVVEKQERLASATLIDLPDEVSRSVDESAFKLFCC